MQCSALISTPIGVLFSFCCDSVRIDPSPNLRANLDWVRISDESRSLRQGVLKTKYEFWGSRVARKRLGRNSSLGAFPLALACESTGHHSITSRTFRLVLLFIGDIHLFNSKMTVKHLWVIFIFSPHNRKSR